jgi:pyridoxamine 5'-phosphate oxidase
MAPEQDPIVTFGQWLQEATASEPNDPNAMTLATSNASGFPSARMVLLKGHDEQGFVFYTNLGSRKATDLLAQPRCALLFHWKTKRRQVRVEGEAHQVGDDEADAYFATRARVSQLGAWASKQSQPLRGRFELEARVADVTLRHPLTVPRPPFWSGFRVVPRAIELWEDRPFRLHMRYRYERDVGATGVGSWRHTELYP